LAGELCKRGHDVHVFAMEIEDAPEAEFQVHSVSALPCPRSLRILSFLVNSARAVGSYDFDIVHGVGESFAMNVFNPHGGVEKAYLRQEFSSVRNRFYFLYKLLKRYLSAYHYLMLWIQKKQYLSDRVRKIIAISEMIKRDIIRYYGVPEEKIAVVLNAVDLKTFHPEARAVFRTPKREELGIDGDTIVLLFAGNNYRLKGLEPLLQALVILREWFADRPFLLLIVGRGRIGRYERMARRLGVSGLTRFLGPVKGMERFYAASDIYVHPTFYDSCSLTVLEALASGLPVVTSRFNGAADAITSERAGRILDDPGDVDDLARSIAYYFDEDRREQARVAARQGMERYSPAYNLEETLRVYYEVAGGRPMGPGA